MSQQYSIHTVNGKRGVTPAVHQNLLLCVMDKLVMTNVLTVLLLTIENDEKIKITQFCAISALMNWPQNVLIH